MRAALVNTTIRRWWFVAPLVLWMGLSTQQSMAASAALYATGFEPADGFSTGGPVAGNDGWVTDAAGGSGIKTNEFSGEGQQAFVGDVLPAGGEQAVYVWRPVNYIPSNAPMVNFSVDMAVVDSSDSNRDVFIWEVYNTNGTPLFSLWFDNVDLRIWRGLDDGTNYFTGWGFSNSTLYTLEINMNFASNRWDAWMNGTKIVTNEYVTTTNAPLTFGDADAVWLLDYAGDNYMLFDNYTVTTDAPEQLIPVVENPVPVGNGQQLIRVNGQNGARYAVEASYDLMNWILLKTNVVTGGFFDYLDEGVVGIPRQFYRARWVP